MATDALTVRELIVRLLAMPMGSTVFAEAGQDETYLVRNVFEDGDDTVGLICD